MLRLGWMSTARGEGSFALLRFVCENIDAGVLDARISVVISNREPGEAAQTDRYFEYVRSRGLPLICESSTEFRRTAPGDDWRTRFDRILAGRIGQYDVDVILHGRLHAHRERFPVHALSAAQPASRASGRTQGHMERGHG